MLLSFIKIKHLVIPAAKQKAMRVEAMEKPFKLSEPRLRNMVFLSCAVHCAMGVLFFCIQGQQSSLALNPRAGSMPVRLVSLNSLPGGGDCKAIVSAPEMKKEDAPAAPPVPQQPRKKTTAEKKPPVSIGSAKPPVSPKEHAAGAASDSITIVQPVSPAADSGNNGDFPGADALSGNAAAGGNEAPALNYGSKGTGAGFGPGGSGQGSGTVRDAYWIMIRSKIEQHKVYPRRATLQQLQGTVVVHFIITLEGIIKNVNVEQSSGFTLLDKAGLKAVKDASPLPRPPVEFYRNAVSIKVPIVFELT